MVNLTSDEPLTKVKEFLTETDERTTEIGINFAVSSIIFYIFWFLFHSFPSAYVERY